ncbi:hypothetical protein [Kitasatospora sp. NPDC087315]|uniref:hypothetical protein n=1 Tax=Kitasatospora sp. NPDC087315 TaxID=3364069 RepID=UPI003822EB4F
MTDQPADLLTAAAQRLREHPTAPYDQPVSEWLDAYAARFVTWRGPHISAELGHALAVARAVLGQNGGQQ